MTNITKTSQKEKGEEERWQKRQRQSKKKPKHDTAEAVGDPMGESGKPTLES